MPKKKRTKSDLASSESPAVTRLSAPSQHASPTDEPRRQSRRKKKAEQKQSKIAAEEVNSVISPITSGNSKSISQSPVGVTAASVVSATTNRRSSVSPKTSKVARNMLQGGAVAESSAKDGDRAILPTKKKRGTAAVDAVGTAPKPAVIPSPAAATKTRADKIASPKAERPSKRKANITSAANGQTTANEPGTLSSPKKLETENAAVTAATTPKPATIQSPTLTTPPTKKSRKSKARRKSKSGETPDAGADVPSVTKFAMNGTSPNDAQASSEKKSMEHAKVGSREKYGRVEDGGATATKKARKHSKAKVAVPDSIATQTSPALTVVLKQSPLRPNGKPSLSPRTQAKVPGEFGVQQDEDNRGGQKPQTGGAPAAGSGSKPSAQGGGHAKPKRVGDGGGESKRKVASESLASPKTKKMKVQDVVSSLVFACVECGGVSGSICACSKCDRVFHLQCLKPRRKRRPPVDWACDNCTGKSMSIVYDQVRLICVRRNSLLGEENFALQDCFMCVVKPSQIRFHGRDKNGQNRIRLQVDKRAQDSSDFPGLRLKSHQLVLRHCINQYAVSCLHKIESNLPDCNVFRILGFSPSPFSALCFDERLPLNRAGMIWTTSFHGDNKIHHPYEAIL